MLVDLFYNLVMNTFAREKIGFRDKILLKIKEFMDIVYDKGDYGFNHAKLYYVYLVSANDQAVVKNKEKTIEYLYKAYVHAKLFDDLRFGNKEYKYQSFLVDQIIDGPTNWHYNYKFRKTDCLKSEMADEIYDFLRNDEKFKELESKI